MEGLDAWALQESSRGLLFQPEVPLQLEQEGVGEEVGVGSLLGDFLEEEVPGRRWQATRGSRSFFLPSAAHGHREEKSGRHYTENADGETDQDRFHAPSLFQWAALLGAREVPGSGGATTLVENLFFDDPFFQN